MKIVGRIIFIIAAFAAMMGITYAAVNGGGSSSASQFENRQFEQGERPFSGGEFERGGRPDDQMGGGWMFGLIKNILVVAVLVLLVVWPKNIARQRKRQAKPIRVE